MSWGDLLKVLIFKNVHNIMIGSKIAILSTILLVSLASTQPCLLNNCISCLTPYTCLECPPLLSCCQSQCSNCTSSNQCSSCIQGYQLNSTTALCQPINSCLNFGCAQCSGTTCTMCRDGFILDHYINQCKKCPQQCEICDIFGKCLKCSFFFYLTPAGTCDDCVDNYCVRCNDYFTCSECVSGYVLEDNLPVCTSCPDHCTFCVSVFACELCQTGYFLDKYSRCSACSSSCTTCFGEAANCTVCNSDTYLLNGTCVPCYLSVSLCVSCIMVNQQVQCLNCTKGLYVENNMCVPCPVGCLTCVNMTACGACQFGYYVNKTQMSCINCQIENCINCANTSYCQVCKTYYSPSVDATTCILCPPNCLQCDKSNPPLCTSCQMSYTVINGNCVNCKNNCYACDTTTALTCQDCSLHFWVSGLLSSASTCMPCPMYCPNCYSPVSCLSCAPGLFIDDDGTCINPGFANCHSVLEYTNNSTLFCAICNTGYYNFNSACRPCQPNCSICNSTDCFQCADGFFLNNQSCSPCPVNCRFCTSSTQCSDCSMGFYLNQGLSLCIKCPLACQKCTSSSNCIQCAYGYFLQTLQNKTYSTCVSCVQPCLMCSSLNQCTYCSGGYYLNSSGACSMCPAGCSTCDSTGSCQLCSDGYSLMLSVVDNVTMFCSPCPQFCAICESKVNIHSKKTFVDCVKCAFGLTLLQNNQCIQCGGTTATLGCQQCNKQGVCTSCFSGFKLSNNKCTNQNYEEIEQENWGLVGASIGLGCFAMILLITALYLKSRNSTQISSLSSLPSDLN